MNPKQIDGRIKNALNSVRQAYRSLIKRVNTSGPTVKIQIQGLEGETGQDYDLFQQFGFTCNPPVETEAIVIPLGGQTSHSIAIATEAGQYRIKSLASGEVAIYNQDGASITLKKGKIINVDCTEYNVNCQKYSITATAGASYTTPSLTTSAQFTAQGQINGNGGMVVSGGTGATFTGNLTHSGGNLSSNGVILHAHVHGGIVVGSANTSGPV